jgi:tetratricopeptide (TPR) repeat protein
MHNIISFKFVIGVTAFAMFCLMALTAGAALGNLFIVFIAAAPLFVAIAVIVIIRRQIKLLESIPKIPSPERKIAVIKGFLLKSRVLVLKNVRRKFLYMLMTAYADKGDYLSALEAGEEIWKFFSPAAKSELTGDEAAIYAEEIIILLHLGRIKPAESLLRELNMKSFSDSAGFFYLKLCQLCLPIYKGEVDEVREKLGQAQAFLSDDEIQKRFPMKDFKHTLHFLDAKLDMLEKRYDEAHALFTTIIHGSQNYRLKRLAGEELQYWTTRF